MLATQDDIWIATSEVARLLGMSRQRVRELDDALHPELTPYPDRHPRGQRHRRRYLLSRVLTYRGARERARAARENVDREARRA